MVRVSSALFPMEVTLAIIKPDALEAGYKKEILHVLKKYKFVILNSGRIKLTRLRAEEFYDDHTKNAPYYEPMIQYMMRRPIFVMALARDNCVRAFRNLMGPKDATKARRTHPQSLRAMFGKDGRFNAIHGSDSAERARREIKFFFSDMILEPYPNKEIADSYFKEKVNPLLIKGLAALAKARPSSDPIATCVSSPEIITGT
ncbi:hypothetical protein AXG93_4360s1240 [Marchantia polymorpha subsp. ruderalis]|uniref:Nucleoside diphosphate kinase-like domain-containing protein n=1 Tax=Marchantia polymorpha subsp. ruderalis TaxID=1480154 RepID=A0A176W1D0_MARPO|nr:hypothetical protein AXG93_4360s1240 [Marchantia polymorpha subsp. ruderalis]